MSLSELLVLSVGAAPETAPVLEASPLVPFVVLPSFWILASSCCSKVFRSVASLVEDVLSVLLLSSGGGGAA